MRDVEGVEDLVKLLTELRDKGSQRIIKSAIRGGLNEVAKQMRRDVAPQAKAARPAIRQKLKGRKTIRAKVGVHVGKHRDKFPKPNRSGKQGQGIAGQNLHWWVAGTKTRRTKTGRPTGIMPAKQPGLAMGAFNRSRGRAFAAMKKRAEMQIVREIAKRNKRR